MTGLAAIKQTLDITKELRSIDEKINVAEFKLRLADLVERLLEAREALHDAKERERDLQQQIDRLTEKLAQKAKMKDVGGLLYELDDDGTNVGEPFCNQCYVKEDKRYRLVYGPYAGGSHLCNNCRGVFGKGGRFSS